MKERENILWKDVLLAIIIASIGYMILKSTTRTGLVDMSIEAILFFSGSVIAFKGFWKSRGKGNKNFAKFQIFYGIAYLIVVISFIMGISYFIKYPNIIEIGVGDVKGNSWLVAMSSIKSFSVILLVFTWSYFYRYLNIKKSLSRNIMIFLLGFLFYLGGSIIIWRLTGDINVLSLGIIVGSIIGIFALISQDKRTRYLTMIFTIYSLIHLAEFYIMGIGKDLTTGINNPVYWGVTVLYVFEVKRWIDNEKL